VFKCEIHNVWVCVCVGFLMCVDVCVCVCVRWCFVMYGCVYVLVF